MTQNMKEVIKALPELLLNESILIKSIEWENPIMEVPLDGDSNKAELSNNCTLIIKYRIIAK